MSGRKVLLALLCMFALLCAIALHLRGTNEDKTVPGPESNQLLPRVRGYVLTSRNSRDINCIELPSLKEALIRPMKPEAGDDPTIHALSGPDAEGRIAYIEDHDPLDNRNNARHLLKTIRLDGTDNSELFSRPGNALWATSAIGKGEIGKALALAPIGGHLAFLTQLKDAQMPGALLSEGLVELWDVEKKTGRKTEVTAIDCGLAWFPDGKRLAVVKLVQPQAPSKDQQAEFFGNTYSGWERIPAVFAHDMVAGTESFVAVGWHPLVSPDGRSVLVMNADLKSYRRIDLEQRKVTPVKWPGAAWREAIAWPAEDISLCWCLPTQGARIKYTESNSPLVGPKLMLTVKLARFNTGEFETVLPYIDPRQVVSFGVVKNNPK